MLCGVMEPRVCVTSQRLPTARHQEGESDAGFGEVRFSPAPLPQVQGWVVGSCQGPDLRPPQTCPVPWSLSCC